MISFGIAQYIADYVNEELSRGNKIAADTIMNAVDAYEGGAAVGFPEVKIGISIEGGNLSSIYSNYPGLCAQIYAVDFDTDGSTKEDGVLTLPATKDSPAVEAFVNVWSPSQGIEQAPEGTFEVLDKLLEESK